MISTQQILSYKDLNKPEISDIANSIIDGSDALLLSPRIFSKEMLENLDAVCREAESSVHHKVIFTEIKESLPKPMEAIYSLCISAVETSIKTNAAAIICLTATGRTAKILARYVLGIDINTSQ